MAADGACAGGRSRTEERNLAVILVCLSILIVLALVSPVVSRVAKPMLGPLAAIALAGIGAAFISEFWGSATAGEAVVTSLAWVPELGVDLGFRVDGLSLTFVVLICGIGALVMLYAGSYFKSHERAGVFFTTLLGFAASMLGLVLTENLIMVFVFWELTSITSYLLIGFDYQREGARKSAQQSLLVTGLGGLALLAGLIVLGVAAGGFEVGDVLRGDVQGHPLFGVAAGLVLLGCFTKSAVFPFHFWLPNAMEAPSPVSALLHSSTMVKAGVYMVARLHPAMSGAGVWDDTLIAFGGATAVYAAFLATRTTGLKKILAYTTVSSLGAMMMLIGMGAAEAAAAYLIAHAMFKGCLFLVAGTVIKKTHVKDVDGLGGLAGAMPVTAFAARLGALSLAGVPPFFGFVGKELMLKAGTHAEAWAVPVTAVIMLTAVFTVYAAFSVGYRPFQGAKPAGLEDAHDPDRAMSVGPVLLAVLGLVAGVLPGLFAGPLVAGTMASISGGEAGAPHLNAITDMLLHPSLPLLLSMAALGGGFVLWRWRAGYDAALSRVPLPGGAKADKVFEACLHGVMGFAEWQTKVLHNGSLRTYVRTVLASAAVLIGAGLLYATVPAFERGALGTASLIDWVLAGIMCVAAVGAVFQRSALAAIAVMGTVGFVGALVFLLYGAPDIAMTQLATETLIVIIFVLVIYHLPKFSKLTSPGSRGVDAVIAGAVGLVMAALTILGAGLEAPGELISAFHTEYSLLKGYGRNVVNVIIVDFRGFDTLGEIFVLGAAAVGLFTILRAPARSAVKSKKPAAAGPRLEGAGA